MGDWLLWIQPESRLNQNLEHFIKSGVYTVRFGEKGPLGLS